jgi:hypothetical protein
MPIIRSNNVAICTEMSFEFTDKTKAVNHYLFLKFLEELTELMERYNIKSIGGINQPNKDISKSE